MRDDTQLEIYKFFENKLPWLLAKDFPGKIEELLRDIYDNRVLSTRPCETGRDAPHFELHMLIGKRHVGMCLWAVKSFLQQCGQRYHIALHDDGTLTAKSIELLNTHLPNVRIFRRADADAEMEAKLADFPMLSTFRFTVLETSNHRGQKYNMFIMSLILLDMNLLSTAEKVMILDADVLFFRRPVEIMNWIDDRTDRGCLYSVEKFRPYRDEHNQLKFGLKAVETLNSGLLCYDRVSVLDLPTLEQYASDNRDLMYTSPVFEQLAFSYLIRRRKDSRALSGDDYAFNYTRQDVTATHFGMKRQFFENIPRVEHLLLR